MRSTTRSVASSTPWNGAVAERDPRAASGSITIMPWRTMRTLARHDSRARCPEPGCELGAADPDGHDDRQSVHPPLTECSSPATSGPSAEIM